MPIDERRNEKGYQILSGETATIVEEQRAARGSLGAGQQISVARGSYQRILRVSMGICSLRRKAEKLHVFGPTAHASHRYWRLPHVMVNCAWDKLEGGGIRHTAHGMPIKTLICC